MKELDDLRRAARALEPGRVADALDRAFTAWRAPHSLWRARLCREHPRYSAQVIETGLCEGLEAWTGERISRMQTNESAGLCAPPGVTAVWLAGSIPSAAFAALALPLVAGSAVYAKTASADPVSARLFAESLRAVDEDVAAAIALGDDDEALAQADAVVAYGRDETVAQLRARVPVHVPFVAHGHKLSAGVIGRDAPLEAVAEAAALEIALYDGRGCLSPAYLFCHDDPAGRALAFAEGVARELERLARELPRGPLDADEKGLLQGLRAGLAARDDTRIWTSTGSLAWTVVLSRFTSGPPFPGQLRCASVVPVRDLDELADWLRSLRPNLSTLGAVGWPDGTRDLAPLVLDAGGARLCPLGRMQFPPLEWCHDGMPPLRPLLRFLDVEDGPPR